MKSPCFRFLLLVLGLSISAPVCWAQRSAASRATAQVSAEDASPQSQPIPSGYVFENPRLLTHQLIWGIVHGVRLLALTCRERGRDSATTAYLDWMDQQWPRVRAASVDLARHYFRRDEASTEALDAALNLKPYLDTPPQLIGPACATLAEALKQDRYDLEKYFVARRDAIRKGDPDFPGAVWEDMDPLPTPPLTDSTPAPADAVAQVPAASKETQ